MARYHCHYLESVGVVVIVNSCTRCCISRQTLRLRRRFRRGLVVLSLGVRVPVRVVRHHRNVTSRKIPDSLVANNGFRGWVWPRHESSEPFPVPIPEIHSKVGTDSTLGEERKTTPAIFGLFHHNLQQHVEIFLVDTV